MSQLRALETRYAGCRFRSRLEARWAVFFDALGIRWEYEPQGFLLPSGPYLPDFWLPDISGGMWFEVKHDDAPEDPRHGELVTASGRRMAISGDVPHPSRIETPGIDDGRVIFPGDDDISGDYGYRWAICLEHGDVVYEFEGRVSRGCSGDHRGEDKFPQMYGHPRVLAAYAAARSARFEHGESGR